MDDERVTELEFRALCEMEDQFATYREMADFANIETYKLVKAFFGVQ